MESLVYGISNISIGFYFRKMLRFFPLLVVLNLACNKVNTHTHTHNMLAHIKMNIKPNEILFPIYRHITEKVIKHVRLQQLILFLIFLLFSCLFCFWHCIHTFVVHFKSISLHSTDGIEAIAENEAHSN